MKKLLFVLMMMWVGGAASLWYWNESQTPHISYRTVQLARGDLLATINATGTLEPEEVVDVGAQIAGEIQSFGVDPGNSDRLVGHGTLVEQGTVLATLEDRLFKARVNQAKAQVAKAQADVEAAEVKVRQTERELERVQRLWKSRSISSQEYDTATSEAEGARAALAVVKSTVILAEANLEEANVNLSYTLIRSPVKGVIVDRRVNIGQTVVASLNAPSLFLIAKDIHRMQIWASVNETDVGAIHPGQKVRFTVSAFPRETFHGEVAQIRLNASMTQSVVTYTVVVDVDNSSGKLLPYLTARLQFEVEERKDVLLVPNSAIRWMPAVHQVAPAHRSEFTQSLRQRTAAGKDRPNNPSERGRDTVGTVWGRDDPFVRPIAVSTGLTDGLMSEVTGGELKEGMEVIVGIDQGSADEASTSPFLPKIKNDKAK